MYWACMQHSDTTMSLTADYERLIIVYNYSRRLCCWTPDIDLSCMGPLLTIHNVICHRLARHSSVRKMRMDATQQHGSLTTNRVLQSSIPANALPLSPLAEMFNP